MSRATLDMIADLRGELQDAAVRERRSNEKIARLESTVADLQGQLAWVRGTVETMRRGGPVTLRETSVVERDPISGAIARTVSHERRAFGPLPSVTEIRTLQQELRRLELVVIAAVSALAVFGVDLTVERGRVRTTFNASARELSQPVRGG